MTISDEELDELKRLLERYNATDGEELSTPDYSRLVRGLLRNAPRLLSEYREALRLAKAWEEAAAQFHCNDLHHAAQVDAIGAMLGPEAYTCDDGTVVPDVLRAKVVELCARLLSHYRSARNDGIEEAARFLESETGTEANAVTIVLQVAANNVRRLKSPQSEPGTEA